MGTSRSQTRIQRAYSGVPKVPALVQPQNNQLIVYSIQLQNAGASSSNVGILKGLNNKTFEVYKDVAATPGAVSISGLLRQNENVALFETSSDAVYVGSRQPFGFFGISLSTVGDGASTLALEYWNGSAWTTLPNYEFFASPTSDYLFAIFPAPVEWEEGGTDLDSEDLPSGTPYYVRVVATSTWPNTTPIADDVIAAEIMTFKNGLSQDASLELSVIETNKPLDLESGEYIFAYFENTNNENTIEISYSFSG